MVSNEEKIELGGYRKCVAYLTCDKSILRRYAVENRLVITEFMEDITDILYAKDLPEDVRAVLIAKAEDLGEGYEYYWRRFTLGGRKLDVVFGEPMEEEYGEITDYFIQAELRTRADRLLKGRKRQMKKGIHIGKAPYGYYRQDKRLMLERGEAFVVKYIFYRREYGGSYLSICRELNDRGFRTKGGTQFDKMTIWRIIHNQKFYQGYLFVDGEWIKGQHTAILGEEELVPREWIDKVVDEETRIRIEGHRKRLNERSVPRQINEKGIGRSRTLNKSYRRGKNDDL